MGLLDRIREKRQQSVLPKEVKEYYKSEQRQRRGVALGLALLALVVTIAMAAGLFFGGRFAYNKIWGKDDPKPSSAANQPTNNQNNNRPTAPPATPPTPPPSTPAPAPSPQPAPSTPSPGDDSLPRTGDEGM